MGGSLQYNQDELRRLLSRRLFVSHEFARNPIRQMAKAVLHYHEKGLTRERDWENGKLSFLVKHLQDLERHRPELLAPFRSALLKSDANTYGGLRHEVAVASSLARAFIPFEKSESPDFQLTGEHSGLAIECTSVKLSRYSFTTADFQKKLQSAIKKKSAADYCNTETALFIDATNINALATGAGILPPLAEVKNYLLSLLEMYPFGSVVLWTFLVDRQHSRFKWTYTRQDAVNVDVRLLDLLSRLYPLGSEHIPQAFFPIRT